MLLLVRDWFLVRATRFSAETSQEDLLDRSRFRAALGIASPSLARRLEEAASGGTTIDLSLWRYLQRARHRPTPFGLFAGTTIGGFAERSATTLPHEAQWRVAVEPAMSTLTAWVLDEVARDTDDFDGRVNLNSIALLFGDEWFVPQRGDNNMSEWTETAITRSDALDAVIRIVRGGATKLSDARARLCEELGVEESDAAAFLLMLLRRELLVPCALPPGSAARPAVSTSRELETTSRPVAGTKHRELARACATLDGTSEQDLTRDSFRETIEIAESLDGPDHRRALYIATHAEADPVRLSKSVRAEVQRFANASLRFPRQRSTQLASFREKFTKRYEQRWVPLLEALHDRVGVGLSPSPKEPWSIDPFEYGDALNALAHVADLTGTPLDITSIVEGLPQREPSPNAPQSLAITTGIAAASAADIDAGHFSLIEPIAFGPSAAFLLGRFARHSDALLSQLHQLAADEQRHSAAELVEVVSLPLGSASIPQAHPRIRSRVVEVTGTSDSRDGTLSASDIEVSVRGSAIMLRSRVDGRMLAPRFSCAAVTTNPTWHRVVDFLSLLANDGLPIPTLGLPGIDGRMHTPRVVFGRTVVRVERWRLPPVLWERSRKAGVSPDLVRQTLERLGVNHVVDWCKGDQCLRLDWQNDRYALDELTRLTNLGGVISLKEHIPTNILHSEDGSHAAEFMFVAGPDPRVSPKDPQREVRTTQEFEPPASMSERVLSLGNSCTYLKIYADDRACNRIVHAIVDEISNHSKKLGIVRWHFLYFADPEPHLRVRFFRNRRGSDAIVRRIEKVLRPFLESGRVWRVQQDTYQRELERYGGTFGIELAERVFDADSDFAIEALEGMSVTDDWRIGVAAVSIARALDDFDLTLDEQIAWLKDRCDGYTKEFGLAESFRKVVGKWRTSYGDALRSVLYRTHDDRHLLDALDVRSAVFASVASDLSMSVLASRRNELLAAYTHLGCARIFTEDLRIREAQALDVLRRELETRRHTLRQP